MPTYAYECTGCGRSFEAFQKMSDSPLALCEECGGALKKLMFPVGIVFKGSGFYVNDYAKKSSDNGSDSASKAPDSAPASSETKTSDSKTETPAAKESSTPAPKAEKSGTETKAPAM
ncbi:MAG TPA: FmdB family zinc ribbon protein [Capsulimonadaceae bacterium]|nr:FmdB family zinc ribbon protein [Capsulimonadaceae bacterium]